MQTSRKNEDEYVFLIYSPNYRETAGGVKALYFLCHYLLEQGHSAYIVPISIRSPHLPNDLQVSLFSRKSLKLEVNKGKKVIGIYSETIPGNPLKLPNYIKYIMNYPGLLGGLNSTKLDEIVLPYSYNIGNYLELQGFTKRLPSLFIPTINLEDFKPNFDKENFFALYAGKYKEFYGSPDLSSYDNLELIEIHRKGPGKQDRNTLKHILSKAKGLICFENSALVNEAVLSGTPVVLIESPLSANPIAEVELGMDGIVNSIETLPNVNIKLASELARAKYKAAIENVELGIENFISSCLLISNYFEYREKIKIPIRLHRVVGHKIAILKQIYLDQGAKSLSIYLLRVAYFMLFIRDRGKNA